MGYYIEGKIMAFEQLAAGGDAMGKLGSGLSSIFGGKTSTSGNTTASGSEKRTGKTTNQLQLDPAAVQKIIQDVLGGADGLASIFSGEQSSGLYNSSTAAQAAGDLTAKLVGEIAKLTGKTVLEEEASVETEGKTTSTTKTKDGGALGGVVDTVKGLFGGLV